MRFKNISLTLALIVAFVSTSGARAQDSMARIKEAELKADLFELAGDAMRGREGGTLDEMTASVWIAERARQAGLQPAGDNGTYFQFFPLERFRVSASSPVTFGGKALRMGRDVVTNAVVLANVNAPIVVAKADALTGVDLKDKALVVSFMPAPPAAGAAAVATAGPGAPPPALRTFATGLQRSVANAGAAAIVILVGDDQKDQWDRVAFPFVRGTYALDPDGTADQRTPMRGVPLLYVRASALGAEVAADARLVASIFTDSFRVPVGEYHREGARPRRQVARRIRAL